ncbi:4'-phosphopantetheinyl transferase superfamily protein [Streptomyces sp. A7024]|uniref:4'-phosphopantetheinyl transferase superfamily protein n=1 Tax=Streptomyces coryli TaxID=1128680 RepID=A0A6G4U4H9_9ACTN|nr:4'-phosphopantetheinyl transferase superfamily protein [Streptomyces coryli]NGN66121.1 4'-phosphopantetheinyl transferase superfamily protein [Streptomyces coryli]
MRIGELPPGGPVRVWLLPAAADEVAAAERLAWLLDDEERRRAERFVFPADREIYLLAHVGLRLLLGSCLACHPRDVVLDRAPCPGCGGPHGRPVPAAAHHGTDLHFSLTHTRGLAVCAVAGAEVGVDAETPDGRSTTVADVLPMLHPAERKVIEAQQGAARAAAFRAAWVRKEAYLKGTGTGISVPLDSVHTGVGTPYEPAPAPAPAGWGITARTTTTGAAWAVAVRGTAGEPAPAVQEGGLATAGERFATARSD